MSRRLPVYILIDTSGSMKGEPIESVKVGLSDMIASLRLDPYALETACISIITYDKDVKQILPLTELENLQLPEIVCPEANHGKTKSVRNQKRNAIFRRKNEMCNKKASKQ